MASLTVAQRGYYDGIVWIDHVLQLTFMGLSGATITWIQVTPNNAELTTAVTTSLTPAFSESGTLTVLCARFPAFTDFTTATPPLVNFADTVLTSTDAMVLNTQQTQSLLLNNTTTGAGTTLAAGVHRSATHRFALGYQWSGTGGIVGINTVDTTTQKAFTGLEGPWRAQGRADECPKCGGKSTRDRWVRDRYTKLMVCPRCYDPMGTEDVGRAKIGSERPGIGEG